jgi:glycosyltransferase involved in cell wall biosynthesis
LSAGRRCDSLMTTSSTRARILVFAYACEPLRGSEPGAGWGVVRTLSELADCTVLVGPEHSHGIRRWQRQSELPGLEFIEVAEPTIAFLAKWHRVSWFLLYLAWLRRADRVGRRLHAERPFDAVSHISYPTYWLPTPATDYGVPSLWGPVGGAVTTPLSLWPALGLRGLWDEILDRVSVRAMSWLPATRRTWQRASVCLIQNQETVARLPRAIRSRAVILNHALLLDVPTIAPRRRGRKCLYVGALESRKGPRLAVRALAHAPEEVSLVMVGEGPERSALLRLARRLGVAHRLELRGSVSRSEVLALLAEAAVAVFTGLREEGGVALAEAMSGGVPVIVLGHGGARVLAEAAYDPARVAIVEPEAVELTARRLGEAMARFVQQPSNVSTPNLDATEARRLLREKLAEAVGMSETRSRPPQ